MDHRRFGLARRSALFTNGHITAEWQSLNRRRHRWKHDIFDGRTLRPQEWNLGNDRFDDDLRDHLRAEMERRGIRIITGKTVAAVEQMPGALRARLSDDGMVDVDKVMFAIGRLPIANGIGP